MSNWWSNFKGLGSRSLERKCENRYWLIPLSYGNIYVKSLLHDVTVPSVSTSAHRYPHDVDSNSI